jgi:prepilin-type N-terminal cleavage/methylation domain-containing protein
MERKYTIYKVLTRNLNKGFTLLELLVGLIIMGLVSGLAMNAFLQASNSFNRDKKNIDTNQNLSAVLEIVGNDIRQAGEGINEGNFPSIEFDLVTATDIAAGLQSGSSKIVIRKAIAPQPLTLCQTIPANVSPLPIQLIIADSVAGTDSSCIFTYAPPSPAPALLPVSAAIPVAWQTAINARQYRCQLDRLNPNYLTTATDLCAATKPTPSSSDREQLRAAVSDGNGRIRVFNYSDDNFMAFNPNYYVSVGKDDAGVSTMSDDARSKSVAYLPGSPIYLIEERVYALDNAGNLTLAINGGARQLLIKKIAQFNISARLYTDAVNQAINPTPAPATVAIPATTISATDFVCPVGGDQPTAVAATATNPQYICQFNYNPLSTDVPMNWKTIAGVRVSLQAKYDATGDSATASADALAKLRAQAEFFPRNVLSK